ncbi:5-formyltetrahydrofolate cyclo-ligase [Dongia sedimenti]|uniref:5-formyltetrahydrofolate cyclo-ligase n=1 Tax=Dongia sedimenti TaxID=3064282 RepID=A0ABU0YPH2_9PROT|nr:5-formyltetrahydrofolate cyclo-ligase [Rhodospirillaceae bacterium R-7]
MNWPEVRAWRREARQKLLAARAAIALSVREDLSRKLIERLRPVLNDRPQPISFYWPIKAEPDLKPLMRALDAAGVRVCLPVAIKLGEPLTFRPWTKGTRMERGLWDIPIPADPAEVEPRTLIAPIVGYDEAGYRLGYGGGFFDRTLAKFGDAAAIGIGTSMFRLPTIHPQPHDIRMAAIVTEAGIAGGDAVSPASAVCYLDESDPRYAGFDTPDETAARLAGLIGRLPPERRGLLDYALWRLGAEAKEAAPTADSPTALLGQALPRVRDDAVHAALSALRSSLTAA